METEELYQDLLNLAAPWCVKAVLVEDGAIKVLVRLEGTEATLHACPRCGYRCMPCDHTKEKTWRHLDTCGKQTFIQARLPVAECPEHGRQPITPPFADADLPVTLALARTVNRIVRDSGSLKRTALIVGLDEDLVRSILRNSPQLAGVWKGPARDSRPCPTAASVPDPTRQLSLFSQDDMILMNQALHAFKSLQLEQAVELFQKYRKTFPRGHDVAAKTALAEFLLKGLQEAPNDLAERVPYLCRLWDRFEDCVQSNSMNPHDRLISEQKKAFFRGMLKEIEQTSPACTVSIIGGIPLGYLFLEAEQHEQAIPHLQGAIAEAPHNASVYGYLGDAYWLRGNSKTARQCYREGCSIDPSAIDWQHLKDDELIALRQELLLLYDFDPELASGWLPSHARVNGLFERKTVRIHEGLKEQVDEYLALRKSLEKKTDPVKLARLFFRGIILCENEEGLRLVKKIDPIDVRRRMKQANPELFADFLPILPASPARFH